MKHALPLADRACDITMRLITAVNILFFLSFLMVAALAASHARAAVPACTGRNIIAGLERDNPALLATIRAESNLAVNGKGVFWKIEKAGSATSYLLGTLHLTDPRVVELPPAAQQAFDAASTVVIETTEVLDPKAAMGTMAKRPELMMFTDSTSLTSLMTKEEAADVTTALEARGIAITSVLKMKPWMLASLLALPQCETARQAAGAKLLDIKLALDAKLAGKTVGGLETLVDQLGAMAALPMEFHIRGLIDTLKLGNRMDDVIETMIVIYEQGDTGIYWPLFKAVLPGAETEAGYAAFEETMITGRNRVMAKNARAFLDRGNAFIAVGALHLPGKQGLVELLRQDGYTMTAVP